LVFNVQLGLPSRTNPTVSYSRAICGFASAGRSRSQRRIEDEFLRRDPSRATNSRTETKTEKNETNAIRPAERIVFTWRWLNDDEAPETVVTIELEASGQETVLSLTQSGFASDDSRDRHEHGWTGSFDKLAALVGAA
jgi:hypothetical protein